MLITAMTYEPPPMHIMPGYWPSVIDSLVRAGLTHAEIARELHVNKSTVHRWHFEITRPGFEAALRLLALSRLRGKSLHPCNPE